MVFVGSVIFIAVIGVIALIVAYLLIGVQWARLAKNRPIMRMGDEDLSDDNGLIGMMIGLWPWMLLAAILIIVFRPFIKLAKR